MINKTAIVIGAGIVGLATARALTAKGFSVSVFEKSDRAVGASIRNFGLVLPFAQPDGILYDRAMRSRSIWKEISDNGAFHHDPVGSLYVAYEPLEWQVLQELYEIYGASRKLQLLSADRVHSYSPAIISKGLLGALFSPDEVIVDPREAIASLPQYLHSKHGVQFYWGRPAQQVTANKVESNGETFKADIVFVCSGADFESLYPQQFFSTSIIKCKLQMMRTPPQPGDWRIGPALCGGLSLVHYKSFAAAPSIDLLKSFYLDEMQAYIEHGIHVMVTQNSAGELTIGDSHEYAQTPDPFDRSRINQLILEYLGRFAKFKHLTIAETWNGVYPKMQTGESEFFMSPEPGVYILNGLGGAGMSLSFGLAEEVVANL